MLETVLKAGSSVGWLPRGEARPGNGGTCQNDIATLTQNGFKYKYLPFAPNGINCALSQGLDVISYNFSGCIMAVFKYMGVRYVCHVSTGGGQDCQAAWSNVKGGYSDTVEYKPHLYLPEKFKGVGSGGCYGLITNDDRAFAVIIYLKDGGNTKIVQAIKKMDPL
jgi:hypothetical protein